MNPEVEIKSKLESLVRRTPAAGRPQVEALIASVINAGGTSESSLVELLHDPARDVQLRLSACWLVSRLKAAGSGSVLKAMMSDPEEQLREEAVVGLALVSQNDDTVEVIFNALQSEGSRSVRLAALHALGMLGSPRSAGGVIAILQNANEDPEVRASAAEALAHVRDDRIVDVLVGCLGDASPLVRYSAAYALGQQGDMKALSALTDTAARDRAVTPWGAVASCALDSLEQINQRAEPRGEGGK
jgi:HEAT repeat protein